MKLFALLVALNVLLLQTTEAQEDNGGNGSKPILVKLDMKELLEHATDECKEFLVADDLANMKIFAQKLRDEGDSVGKDFLRENGCETVIGYLEEVIQKAREAAAVPQYDHV